jgi:23S rRNA (cytosine1962-C5)-methyltransferase
MPLLAGSAAPVHLVLSRDRIKDLKSGHPWVYAESIAVKPQAPSGSLALVKTKDGEIIAKVSASITSGIRR